MNPEKKINFYYLYKPFPFTNRNPLKEFILSIFKKEKTKVGSVTYIFCNDAFLLPLNKAFLKHNTLTDIITFILSEPDEPLTSEIYLSVDRIKENAKLYQTSFQEELHRVIFHGVLHLCGYKDKSKSDQKKMREMENFYLDKYFVSRETL